LCLHRLFFHLDLKALLSHEVLPFDVVLDLQGHPILTGPPIFDPQHHNDWLHRNLVGKNVVSSPDKSAVPLTDDLPRIPILPVEQYTLVQRIKFVNQCLINAGFPRVGDYLLTLTTETFNSHRKGATNQSKKCTNLQLQEWTWGLPNLLKNLDDF